MKRGSVLMAACILCGAAANGADGSKLLGACTTAATQGMIPPGMTSDEYVRFCQSRR
jgi:hypothetical protein